MRAILRACGELCLTLGAVVVLLVCYLFWGPAQRTEQAQHQFAVLWLWVFPWAYTRFPW